MSTAVKHRVLVVDDDESVREVFALLLRKEGYEVTAAENGFDGLLKLKQLVPDVIISDLNMPKLDGLGLLRALRTKPGFENIPFILLTSRAETDTVKKAVELKVNNYLVKPFAVDALKRKIEAVIGPLV